MFRKKLIVLGFRPFHAATFSSRYRGADRPGQSALPLVDHSEFGDLKFPSRRCHRLLESTQGCLFSDVEHYSAIDLSGLESRKNVIDGFQWLCLNGRLNLAFGRKGQCLLLNPCAYLRSIHGWCNGSAPHQK